MYLKLRRNSIVKHCKTIEKQIQIARPILMGYPRIHVSNRNRRRISLRCITNKILKKKNSKKKFILLLAAADITFFVILAFTTEGLGRYTSHS